MNIVSILILRNLTARQSAATTKHTTHHELWYREVTMRQNLRFRLRYSLVLPKILRARNWSHGSADSSWSRRRSTLRNWRFWRRYRILVISKCVNWWICKVVAAIYVELRQDTCSPSTPSKYIKYVPLWLKSVLFPSAMRRSFNWLWRLARGFGVQAVVC
jgi:hypothetical protein